MHNKKYKEKNELCTINTNCQKNLDLLVCDSQNSNGSLLNADNLQRFLVLCRLTLSYASATSTPITIIIIIIMPQNNGKELCLVAQCHQYNDSSYY